MNLYMQTLCEAYHMRERFGYRLFKDQNVLNLFWNDPAVGGLNSLYCSGIEKEEMSRIRFWSGRLNGNLCVHSDTPVKTDYEKFFRFEETAALMMLDASEMKSGTPDYETSAVRNEEDLRLWTRLAAEIFEMQKDEPALYHSLLPDLTLENAPKYIGKINGIPAGIAASTTGTQAVLIEWVGVLSPFRRRGLCSALLTHTVQREKQNGHGRFVLSASQAGYKAYCTLGFKTLCERYDYILAG